jgi:hypothetical protein
MNPFKTIAFIITQCRLRNIGLNQEIRMIMPFYLPDCEPINPDGMTMLEQGYDALVRLSLPINIH